MGQAAERAGAWRGSHCTQVGMRAATHRQPRIDFVKLQLGMYSRRHFTGLT